MSGQAAASGPRRIVRGVLADEDRLRALRVTGGLATMAADGCAALPLKTGMEQNAQGALQPSDEMRAAVDHRRRGSRRGAAVRVAQQRGAERCALPPGASG